jgi:hypothetical protein
MTQRGHVESAELLTSDRAVAFVFARSLTRPAMCSRATYSGDLVVTLTDAMTQNAPRSRSTRVAPNAGSAARRATFCRGEGRRSDESPERHTVELGVVSGVAARASAGA